MGDWPTQTQDVNQIIIGPQSTCSIGGEIAKTAAGVTSSVAWPAANRAIYVPFVVYNPIIILKIGVSDGATTAGNFDVGVYDDQQNRLVSSGAVAQSGVNTVQEVDITDTTLNPGLYYMAMSSDSTANVTTFAWAPALGICQAAGVLSQSTAYTLPSPGVFAAAQDAYIPGMYLLARTLV